MTAKRAKKPISTSYVRTFDDATMVEIAPHQFVSAASRAASSRRAGDA